MSAHLLLCQQENYYNIHPHKDGQHFRPVIEAVDDEEAFMTEHPLEIVTSGKALRVPLMTGVVADEGLFASMGKISLNIQESQNFY